MKIHIPEEWMIIRLEQLASKISDGIHSTPKYADTSPIYFINGNNLKNGKIIINGSTKSVDEEDAPRHYRELTDRTILMSINGTIGSLAFYRGESVVLGKSACYINVKKNADLEFVYYALSGRRVQRFYESELTGSTIRNLSLKSIKNTKVHLPPLPEQKAIADLLSTWDEAIEKIERLIQVKEKRFKWLLRELISEPRNTQKDAKWKKVKLGELCKVSKGKQLNVAHMKADGEYYALNGGIEPSGRTDDWNTEAETITISEGGNSCGYVNYNTERFWSGGHCYSLLSLKKNVDKHYLYFYLKMNEPKLMKLRVGSGLPNIQKKDVDKFIVAVPPFPEQQKIAETLSSAQHEIDLLKQIADKYKTQKRGLMQKMLTGEWRVKPEIVNQYMEA